jgi:hypothetical protein
MHVENASSPEWVRLLALHPRVLAVTFVATLSPTSHTWTHFVALKHSHIRVGRCASRLFDASFVSAKIAIQRFESSNLLSIVSMPGKSIAIFRLKESALTKWLDKNAVHRCYGGYKCIKLRRTPFVGLGYGVPEPGSLGETGLRAKQIKLN